ncbi:amidase family protein [Streptomyces sp. NPDC048282]|uniref:amidase family protein n=1 Tax=Streptomyces sp. NPDC048282 TaxID=3365528 RepID=UPI003719E826
MRATASPFAIRRRTAGASSPYTLNPSIRGLRIAFSPDFGSAEVDHEVLAIVEAAAESLESTGGARVDKVEMSVPDPVEYFSDCYAPAFASFLEMETPAGQLKDTGIHPAIEYMAARGRTMSATEWFHTLHVTRTAILQGFLEVFAGHDLIVSPTMPVAPFPHPGPEAGNTHVNGRPVVEPMIDFHRLTESPTHAMLPAITVNCGFTRDGLPVGMQIVGPQHADGAILAAAAAFETFTDWGARRPPIA